MEFLLEYAQRIPVKKPVPILAIASGKLVLLYSLEDTKEPKLIKKLPHYDRSVEDIVIAGDLMAASDLERNIILRDIRDLKKIALASRLESDQSIRSIALSERYLAASYGDSITVRDISDPYEPIKLLEVRPGELVRYVGLMGETLVAVLEDKISLRGISKDPVFFGLIETGDKIYRLAMSKNLLAASFKNKIEIRDLSSPASPRLVASKEAPYRVSRLAISRDERYLAIAFSEGPRIAEVREISEEPKIVNAILDDETHTGSITAIAFSPDDHLLALGGEDYKVSLRLIREGSFYAKLITFFKPRKFPASKLLLFKKRLEVEGAPIRRTLRLELENNPRDLPAVLAYKEAAELALAFFERPIEALKEAASKGVLDILVEILLKDRLIEERDGAYYLNVPAEKLEGKILKETIEEERLEDIAEEIARCLKGRIDEISKLFIKEVNKEKFIKKLRERLRDII